MFERNGEFHVGAAIGAGAVAQAAERGGADFLLVLTAGRVRMRGGPSIACMMPLASANDEALRLAGEEITPACKVPVFVGLSAMDPGVPFDGLIAAARAAGCAGVMNFPTVAHYSRSVRDALDQAGCGFEREIALLQAARAAGLATIAHVTSADQARRMAQAGVDAVCFNYGWNTGGSTGAPVGIDLSEASVIAAEIRRQIRLVRTDCLFMLEGGPIETAEDLTTVLEASRADGYIGGSTIDRLPLETSVVNQTITFKNAARALGRRKAQRLAMFGLLARAGLAGTSQGMFDLAEEIAGFGKAKGVVVATGEAGTGRRRILDAVILARRQRLQSVITLDTAALTSAQMIQRLFGRVGEEADDGLLARHDGVIVLGDLDDLPRPLQRRLGRFLEHGDFAPVGGRRRAASKATILLVGRRSLGDLRKADLIDAGLYDQIESHEIRARPLRERPEDIEEILDGFLRAQSDSPQTLHIAPSALRLLRAHPWPGNLTEARSVALRLLASARDGRVSEPDVAQILPGSGRARGRTLANERQLILDALWRHGFNRTRTAEFLNVTRKTLYNKIRRYGITRQDR